MTQDVDVLITWLMVVIVIAALAATTVPILYSFFPWRQYKVGRLFMFQSVSFAAAVDLTVLFQFWVPNILVLFWINALVFTAIAASTSLTVWTLWRIIHPRKGKTHAVQ